MLHDPLELDSPNAEIDLLSQCDRVDLAIDRMTAHQFRLLASDLDQALIALDRGLPRVARAFAEKAMAEVQANITWYESTHEERIQHAIHGGKCHVGAITEEE